MLYFRLVEIVFDHAHAHVAAAPLLALSATTRASRFAESFSLAATAAAAAALFASPASTRSMVLHHSSTPAAPGSHVLHRRLVLFHIETALQERSRVVGLAARIVFLPSKAKLSIPFLP